jgi:hypothetical protein
MHRLGCVSTTSCGACKTRHATIDATPNTPCSFESPVHSTVVVDDGWRTSTSASSASSSTSTPAAPTAPTAPTASAVPVDSGDTLGSMADADKDTVWETRLYTTADSGHNVSRLAVVLAFPAPFSLAM